MLRKKNRAKRDNKSYKKNTNNWIWSRTSTTKTKTIEKKTNTEGWWWYCHDQITQRSSLESKEIQCNLIDDEDDEYDNKIVLISNKVITRMSNNDEKMTKNWIWSRHGNGSGSKSDRNISALGNKKWRRK